jgi:hypothetical protein
MLRLIDVFMDSGPQVLLQLYVITTQKLSNYDLETNGLPINNQVAIFTWTDFLNQENRLVLKQVISISSSLFSMAYALAGYHRCLRNQQYLFCVNKSKRLVKPISWFSTIMQFLWYLFLISPRVLSMALFASTFRSWFFMIIFLHWLIMYFWILNLKTNYCITSINVYNAREEIFEKFYNFVCSFIYIFVYFNLKSGKTRYRYITYYIIFYFENILFSISYYCFSNEKNTFFKVSMLCIIIIGFWLAIIFQIIYYLYFHPSQDISLCVRRQDKFHFIHVNTLRHRYSVKKTSHDTQRKQIKIETKNVEVHVDDVKESLKNEEKFEYKLFHLNDNEASSQTFSESDSEAARSFKSVNFNKSSSSIASILSNRSSLYHSISNRKQQQSLYGSCFTLKEDQENSFSYNPLFISYDLNSFNNVEDGGSSGSLDTVILKRQIELLKIKETSL